MSPHPPFLATLSLRSAHPGRCLAFYQTLGLSFEPGPEPERPSYFHTQLAGARFEIHPATRARPAVSAPSLGFCSPSVDELARALIQEGFKVLPAPDGSSPGAQALALDPDGRSVELFQIDPDAPSCPPDLPDRSAEANLSDDQSAALAEAARQETEDILAQAADKSRPAEPARALETRASQRPSHSKKTRAMPRSVV